MDALTWTSAASPGPAPSRSEAFRFSSWKAKVWRLFFFFNFLTLQMFQQRYDTQGVTRQREGSHGSPFSGGPWLLAWGKVEGWVCISGFCQWSSSGFRRWMEAVKEWGRNKKVALLAMPSDACTAVKNAEMLLRDSLRCTYCSCQHVIHQSPEAPPVHGSVMSAPHQDLRSPGVGERNGRLDTAETSQRKRKRLRRWNMISSPKHARSCDIHVFNGAAEGVGDCSIVDGLFA